MEIKYTGKIINGKLQVDDADMMRNEIALLTDGKVEIIIKSKRKLRSLPQNSYYWGVVIPHIQKAIKEIGENMTLNETEKWIAEYLCATDSEFIHLFLKEKFIERMKVIESTGEIIETKKLSTRLMNKDEFGDYLNRVIQFANETLQIYIPSPNEN